MGSQSQAGGSRGTNLGRLDPGERDLTREIAGRAKLLQRLDLYLDSLHDFTAADQVAIAVSWTWDEVDALEDHPLAGIHPLVETLKRLRKVHEHALGPIT
jgi:hypothetical protein